MERLDDHASDGSYSGLEACQAWEKYASACLEVGSLEGLSSGGIWMGQDGSALL
jgi:hypothetical protein